MVEDGLGLRERALLAWRRERPAKEAKRLELKAMQLEAVRRRLAGMFGTDFDITTRVRDDGTITARVGGVSFGTFIYDEETITVIPLVVCPSCEKEVSLGGVADLAELGEAFEAYELGLVHEC